MRRLEGPIRKKRRKYKRRKTDIIQLDNSDSEEDLDLLECWDEMTENIDS